MPDRPDLAAVLPPLEAVDALPPESLPGLIAGLAALQARAAVRMATVSKPEHDEGTDRLLTVDEAAARTCRSRDYLYRHADTLPFIRRIGRAVRCSEAGLTRWMACEVTASRPVPRPPYRRGLYECTNRFR